MLREMAIYILAYNRAGVVGDYYQLVDGNKIFFLSLYKKTGQKKKYKDYV
jgi:hypothetical protein